MAKQRLTVLGIVLIIIGTAFGVQAKDLAFPALTGRVVDQAQVLSPQTTATLDQRLAAFEAQTGHQIVVVTLNDTGDTDIADYGYQLGRHWQIGRAGHNDGVILLVVPSTRQVRIDVGYGLEGDLTDAASSLIINTVMIPFFKRGQLDDGVIAGVQAIMSMTGGEGQAVVKKANAATQTDWVSVVLVVFLVLWIFGSRRGRRSGLAPFLLGSMLGGGGRGGFGGGSSGGFGGGGSFGGGGASGRW